VETRQLIEPTVARMAAENRDPSSAQRLQAALAYEASIGDRDPRYVDAANDFHYVVASMTGNRVMDVVATALKEMYTSRVVHGGLAQQKAEKLMREHVGVYLGRMKDVAPAFVESPITWA
jgi:DNA-binding FadR family transcriptional regulator